MSYRRSSVKGAASFRRLLKRLPDSANAGLLTLLQRAGPVLAERMKGRLPSRRGDAGIHGGISWRVTPSTLNLKVGILVPKLARSDYFYGHILDVGRRAQIVTATHRHTTGNSYALKITAKPGLFVVSAGLADFKTDFLPNYRLLMDGILSDAARGAGDD